MCRRKGKRVLIAWSVRRPLARCIWHYRRSWCVFLQDTASTLHQGRRHHRCKTRHVWPLDWGRDARRRHTWFELRTPKYTIIYQQQHLPGAIPNARAWLYARQGHASMVHVISQAQLLWHRRLFPLGHTPTTPCKRQFVHTRPDPNKVTMLPFANRGVSPSP
jgi:hypothetical protein